MRRIVFIVASLALVLMAARFASAFTISAGSNDSRAAFSHSMMFGGHNEGVRQLGSDPAARPGAKSLIVNQGVLSPDWFFKNRRR
jgi:hypothetical protein